MGPARIAGWFRHSGFWGTLGVVVVVAAFMIVPQQLARLAPSHGAIKPGAVVRVGSFTYSPNASWIEDRGGSRRGTSSIISKGGLQLGVLNDPASTPRQVYARWANRWAQSPSTTVGQASEIKVRSGLVGLRGTIISPAGQGMLAAFATSAGGVIFIASSSTAVSPGTTAELDAMIDSVKAAPK